MSQSYSTSELFFEGGWKGPCGISSGKRGLVFADFPTGTSFLKFAVNRVGIWYLDSTTLSESSLSVDDSFFIYVVLNCFSLLF